jgi:RND superfamily putative drug exporter
MVSVFFSFALGVDVYGKMFGIGLAAAVLIDATIVRMVLVPATMELLGDRNWWLPDWLDRILPNIDVEGHEFTGNELRSSDQSAPERPMVAQDGQVSRYRRSGKWSSHSASVKSWSATRHANASAWSTLVSHV